jgi:hypothetical protein
MMWLFIIVVGYLIFGLFVMSLMVTAKRADKAMEDDDGWR